MRATRWNGSSRLAPGTEARIGSHPSLPTSAPWPWDRTRTSGSSITNNFSTFRASGKTCMARHRAGSSLIASFLRSRVLISPSSATMSGPCISRWFRRQTARTCGSSAVASWSGIADRALLDEIHVQLAPVTLGDGAPLLPRRLGASDLTLARADRDKQFVYLVYQVARERRPRS